MKPFYVRDIPIDPPLILSPMAGVTDYIFRRLIKRRGGVGLVVSEFISVEGLTRGNPKSKRQMRFDEEERPFAVQIFGGRPERMAMGAEMAEEIGADIVDINCGCPAPKVVKNGGGSGLLRDPQLLETILKEIKRSISIPLTLKVRTGYTESSINVVDIAKMAEQCGVEHIQVHGRTREQGYSGYARWEWIRAVKQAVKIPVIGNGDIRTPEDACAMVAATGCDAVMIGRTAPANPWIFRQIQQYCQSRPSRLSEWANPPLGGNGSDSENRDYDQPSEGDRYQMIRTYFQMLIEEELPDATGKMKQFASWFTHGVSGGAALRKEIYESKTAPEILARVEGFFEARLCVPSSAGTLLDQ